MGKTSKFVYLFIAFLFFLFVDFYLSNSMVSNCLLNINYSNPFFKLVYAENTGAAFSIMENSVLPLIFIAVIALIGIFYYLIKNISEIKAKELFFFAILMAGISLNLLERLLLGHVRDFFELTFVNFPIFNVSDIFINIGILGIIILVLLGRGKAGRN